MFVILRHLGWVVAMVALLLCAQCGSGGRLDSAGNEVEEDDDDGKAGVQLSTRFVRQGITSSYVETENFRATVYVGKQVYQDSDSTANSSFSPQPNIMVSD